MTDKSRVSGWLRHQLVYKVVTRGEVDYLGGTNAPAQRRPDYEHYVVFSLVIVPGTYGSRVAVYRNGERLGRSLRLGGANAVDTATETIARSLGIAGIELMDEGTLHHLVDTPNQPWALGLGQVTLIARV